MYLAIEGGSLKRESCRPIIEPRHVARQIIPLHLCPFNIKLRLASPYQSNISEHSSYAFC